MSAPAGATSLGAVRGAFEATGSPSWIMRTIQRRELDRRHGFELRLDLGGDEVRQRREATAAVLADGGADVIDTDWLSIARLRREGLGVTAVFPYGRILGGVVVPDASPVRDLPGLGGRTIGVVHARDKNWLVLRAAGLARHGVDLARQASVVELGSKTLLLDALERGAVDAAALYWHLVPPLVAGGRFRQLCDVLDLVEEVSGASPPTTFFVLREEFVAGRRDLVRAFVAAYREAVRALRASPAAWAEAVGGPALAAGAAAGLRASWARRVCADWGPGDVRALSRLFHVLRDLAGHEAVGGLDVLPPGMFDLGFTEGGAARWSP